MKVYIVSGLISDIGDPIFEVFSNKNEAKSKLCALKKDKDLEMFDLTVEEFSINKKGILKAIKYGADKVYK